jgi:hypothetical protein
MNRSTAQIAVPVLPLPEFEEVVTLVGDLIKEQKGRPVVVRPVVTGHSAAEVSLCVVGSPLRCVDDQIFFAMFAPQVLGNLIDTGS